MSLIAPPPPFSTDSSGGDFHFIAAPELSPAAKSEQPHSHAAAKVPPPTAPADEAKEAPVWQPGKHCLELDGVRGLAILLVTAYRICKEFDGSTHPVLATIQRFSPIGERGVDLFFVLSGFLITGILLQTKRHEGYFRTFMARRALRIFPLYFVALAVCLGVLPWLLPTSHPAAAAVAAAQANKWFLLSYTSNVWMSLQNAWNFGLFDHFWSLAVEEHFYLVWPAVVLLLSTRGLALVAAGTIVCVGLMRTVAAMQPGMDVAVDVLTVFRCDALCFGALLATALLLPQSRWIRIACWMLLPLGFVAGLVVAAHGGRLMTLPHSLMAMFWGTVIGLLVTARQSWWPAKVARWQPLRWLGRYSYGMYVVQLPLLTLLPLATLGGGKDSLTLSVAYFVAMFTLICALAYVSFHCFEKWFLRLKPKYA